MDGRNQELNINSNNDVKVKKDFSIFNKKFFCFSFKLMASKISVYIGIFVYLFIIACYSIIVPRVADKAPISLYNLSTSTMFLMFSVAVVTCYIAIEIFRTGIDDGTELLTVSKPISRKEIVFVKLTIFLIYVLIISVLGMGISAFTYLDDLSTNSDSTTIMLGTFTGTIVNGIIFGSIVTIISIYLKKITSMLISVGLAFILMMATMLTAFVMPTPVNNLSDNSKALQTVNAVSVSSDGSTVSIQQGLVGIDNSSSTNSSTTSTNPFVEPSSLWRQAVRNSGYNNSIKFDFGYQLSNLFILNKIPADAATLLSTMSFLNQGADLNFSYFNTSVSSANPGMSHITVKPTVSWPNAGTAYPYKYLYLNTTTSSSITSSTMLHKYRIKKSYSYNEFAQMNKTIYDYNEANSSTNGTASSTTSVKYWEDAWNKYKETNGSSGSGTSSSTTLESFVTKFFKERTSASQNNGQTALSLFNRTEAQELLKEFNTIQYSAYLNLLRKGVSVSVNATSSPTTLTQWFDAIAKGVGEEEKVELGLLGINLFDQDDVLSNTIDFKYQINSGTSPTNTMSLSIANPFNLMLRDWMNTARVTTVVSVMKNEIVIPVWVSIAVILFIVSMVLYYKRDFA